MNVFIPCEVPQAPTNMFNVSSGIECVVLSFSGNYNSAPGPSPNDGGNTILEYVVSYSKDGAICTVSFTNTLEDNYGVISNDYTITGLDSNIMDDKALLWEILILMIYNVNHLRLLLLQLRL